MTLLPRATLAAVVAALALTGCSGGGSDAGAAPATTSTSPTTTPSAPAHVAFPTYVALGDSYTAAPLVPTTDTSNGCLRSSNNYPALVAAALPGTQLTDVSCSGADSASLVGVQQVSGNLQPAQFDALQEDTSLVTVGIGGNDDHLFATVIGTCSQLGRQHPQGSPCTDRFTHGGTDRLGKELDAIRTRITAIVTGIRDRSPKARIVVVGYPQIVPASGTCPQLPLARGDYPYVRSVNVGLARALQRGAAAGKADYVDLFAATAGHDICAKDPWINGATTDPSAALAFHPFAAEQQKAAQLVLADLRR
ncbi:MAG: SGNH/GDSL hydrolase family protein [Nocardioides sp.]